jgi:hypothetical protein
MELYSYILFQFVHCGCIERLLTFLKLILYPVTLQKLFMVSRSFWVESFGSLRYRIMLSANRNTLAISIPICIPFICSSWLISQLGILGLCWIGVRKESGHPCLIPNFSRNGFSFYSLSMMLAIGLSYIAFIMLRYTPNIPSFLRTSSVQYYQRLFFASIEMIKWFLSLLKLMCCNTFIDLHMLNHPCLPGMKLTWSRWMIFLICYWIWFAIILLRIFKSIFIKEIGL